jgi:hypothetical protein
MKTAMEIAIESYKNDGVSFTDWFLDNYEMLIEKEKEQMLSFGLYVKKNGWVGCKIEDLYEDYNNQNK